jgi:hypothetical protein
MEEMLLFALVWRVEPLGYNLISWVRKVEPLWIQEDVDEVLYLLLHAHERAAIEVCRIFDKGIIEVPLYLIRILPNQMLGHVAMGLPKADLVTDIFSKPCLQMLQPIQNL